MYVSEIWFSCNIFSPFTPAVFSRKLVTVSCREIKRRSLVAFDSSAWRDDSQSYTPQYSTTLSLETYRCITNDNTFGKIGTYNKRVFQQQSDAYLAEILKILPSSFRWLFGEKELTSSRNERSFKIPRKLNVWLLGERNTATYQLAVGKGKLVTERTFRALKQTVFLHRFQVDSQLIKYYLQA